MNRTWTQSLLALRGVGVSIVPKLACPACWPAYAGLLSSVGLGFLISTAYLLALTVAFLVLALAALVVGANERRGYGPFIIGLVAGGGVLLGKFAFESNLIVYAGLGLLVIASLWNAWLLAHTAAEAATCHQCPREEV